MTVAVAGLWELGWSVPLTEADLWSFFVRDFAVDEWMMVPVTGIYGRGVIEFPDMESLLDANRGRYAVVFVDEKGREELSDFKHPQNALYIFGKAAGSPFLSHACDVDLSLRIETPCNQGLLWPHQAAAIVLYHRTKQ